MARGIVVADCGASQPRTTYCAARGRWPLPTRPFESRACEPYRQLIPALHNPSRHCRTSQPAPPAQPLTGRGGGRPPIAPRPRRKHPSRSKTLWFQRAISLDLGMVRPAAAMSQLLTRSRVCPMLTGRRGARVWDFWPRTPETRDIKARIVRLEKNVVDLIIKVRKMAQGQAHFEQSFTNLQNSITDLGTRLDQALKSMIAAHDSDNDQAFEQHATALDTMVNEVRNLGTSDNQATTAGASPQTAAGASTGDLPQNAGPTEETPPAPPSG